MFNTEALEFLNFKILTHSGVHGLKTDFRKASVSEKQ